MQTHPMTIIHNDADIRITNVLKALSSACPIICFLGMMITPTCTKFKLVTCKQSKGVNYNRKVGSKNRKEKKIAAEIFHRIYVEQKLYYLIIYRSFEDFKT